MSLHLVKLCVGVETPQRLRELQSHEQPPYCTTRNTPRRKEELLAGGSLYWVFQGKIRARQKITGFRPVVRPDGLPYCRMMLSPELVLTRAKVMRPFQGWRYLEGEAAPPDFSKAEDIPPEAEEELRALGLL